LRKQYLAPNIWELIHNDTEKASHGGIAKARDIHYQGRGRLIGLASMIAEFSLLLLGCKKLLHVVLGLPSQEFNTSCQNAHPAIW
jgi:hypothetical protein